MIMTSVVITTAVTFYGHNGHVHNDDVQWTFNIVHVHEDDDIEPAAQ